MKESLSNIYKGHATTIKNKTYFTTKQYVEPFVNALKSYTDKFICEVKVADQLDGNGNDLIYNKVLVTGIFPSDYDFTIDKTVYHRVVCMTYSLDTRKPMCKFYTGVVDPDLNFYGFGDNCMSIQDIEDNSALDYSSVQTVINNGLKDNCKAMLSQLINLQLDNKPDILGHWVDFAIKKEFINDAGKVKLSNTLPIEVYKDMTMDKDSDFYTEGKLSVAKVLQAFSARVNEDQKDLNNRYEKIQLVNKLLGL